MRYALPFLLLLGACQMQSPAPVYTAEEAQAYAVCDGYVHSDMKAFGMSDPMAACMQAYKHGWRDSNPRRQ